MVVSGGGCCLAEPLLPKTYGIRVPTGRALAFAAGAKLANPALVVTACLQLGAALAYAVGSVALTTGALFLALALVRLLVNGGLHDPAGRRRRRAMRPGK